MPAARFTRRQGFKRGMSRADAAHALVAPNGCGKDNGSSIETPKCVVKKWPAASSSQNSLE